MRCNDDKMEDAKSTLPIMRKSYLGGTSMCNDQKQLSRKIRTMEDELLRTRDYHKADQLSVELRKMRIRLSKMRYAWA